jgi:rod shape-determining protein MreC
MPGRRAAASLSGSSSPQRNGRLLAVLVASQLLLVSASTRDGSGPLILESWLRRLSAPGVALARGAGAGLEALTGPARELLAVRGRNRVLEQRLRRLSDLREALGSRSVACSVVTSRIEDGTGLVVLDRGERDGLTTDMPVVAWGGVVGRVVQVDPRRAKVRLLTDAGSGVAGVVQRSRAQGIVVGGHAGRLDLKYVAGHEDVVLGDRVVSSGLDGIFPRGFGLGRVAATTEEFDGSRTYHLEPELDFRAVEEVLVLIGPHEAPRLAGGGEAG